MGEMENSIKNLFNFGLHGIVHENRISDKPPLINALHGGSQMVVCGGTMPIIEL